MLVIVTTFCLSGCLSRLKEEKTQIKPIQDKNLEPEINASNSSCKLYHDEIVNLLFETPKEEVVRSLFSNPSSVISAQTSPNEYDETLTDTLYTIKLKNNEYLVYGIPDKRFLYEVEFSQNEFRLYQGLKIGMSREELGKIINQDIPNDCKEIVISTEEETAELIIQFSKNVIRKMNRITLV